MVIYNDPIQEVIVDVFMARYPELEATIDLVAEESGTGTYIDDTGAVHIEIFAGQSYAAIMDDVATALSHLAVINDGDHNDEWDDVYFWLFDNVKEKLESSTGKTREFNDELFSCLEEVFYCYTT